jgi:hypothetical protein
MGDISEQRRERSVAFAGARSVSPLSGKADLRPHQREITLTDLRERTDGAT